MCFYLGTRANTNQVGANGQMVAGFIFGAIDGSTGAALSRFPQT
jgi:hypothetical protein